MALRRLHWNHWTVSLQVPGGEAALRCGRLGGFEAGRKGGCSICKATCTYIAERYAKECFSLCNGCLCNMMYDIV